MTHTHALIDTEDAARYLAEAEILASAPPGLPAPRRDVRRAGVIGAGTMGRGIAMAFANAGIAVQLVDPDAEARQRAAQAMDDAYAGAAAKARMSPEQARTARGRIALTDSLSALADADAVIEAVFEDLALKQRLYAEVCAIIDADCLLATNTSFLDLNAIGSAASHAERTVGMHFFSPANIMPLVEVVQGRDTAPQTLADALALALKLGKKPVAMRACDGFVGNRMLSRRTIEAESLLLHGALPHEVDGVLTRFGFPMGPFAMTDMAGVDVNWRTRKARGLPLAIADAICEAGRLGQKTGKGYYRYAPGSRAPIPDPQVQALIEGIAQTAGIERESFSDTEIRERLLYPMINEGVRILSEGVIRRASDIDVVWRYGYGWPAASVGPMRYADEAGLVAVCDALDRMARKTGRESLVPHPLLRELAATGRSLAAQPVPEKTPISS